MPNPTAVPLFNSTTPAAPSGYQNTKWQTDGGQPIQQITTNVPGTGQVEVKTGSYSILIGDCGVLIVYNSASAGTFTLPSPPPFNRWLVLIQNIGTGALTLSPNGLNLDNSSSSLTIGKNQGVVVQTDGTNYFTERGVSAAFADNETPSGTVNGTNTSFTLVNSPNPSASLMLFVNGVLQIQGTDYTLSSGTITFTSAPSTGALLTAFYRY